MYFRVGALSPDFAVLLSAFFLRACDAGLNRPDKSVQTKEAPYGRAIRFQNFAAQESSRLIDYQAQNKSEVTSAREVIGGEFGQAKLLVETTN